MKKITDIFEQYVYDLEDEELISDSVKSTITAPELFFEMNRKLWHKKLVRRSIEKTDRVQAGQEPATDEDVQMMLSYCEKSPKFSAIWKRINKISLEDDDGKSWFSDGKTKTEIVFLAGDSTCLKPTSRETGWVKNGM